MTLASSSVAVITGAASGIGRALAVRMADAGIAGIAVSDVNEPGLADTAALAERPGVKVTRHVGDVSKLGEVERLAGEVIAGHGRVTHLINNAGVGLVGRFDQLAVEDIEWVMGINFWGVVYGCKVFLPLLQQAPESHIVNISSLFGIIAPEEQTAYCASKFAVRGFTESLRHELSGSGVSVTSVHPGGVRTNIVRNSRVGDNAPDEWKQSGEEFFDKIARTSPEAAADEIVRAIQRKAPMLLIGRDARLSALISRIFPEDYAAVLERMSGHRLTMRKK